MVSSGRPQGALGRCVETSTGEGDGDRAGSSRPTAGTKGVQPENDAGSARGSLSSAFGIGAGVRRLPFGW